MTQLGHRQVSTVMRYVHFASNARAIVAEKAILVPLAGMAAASKPKAKVLRLKGGSDDRAAKVAAPSTSPARSALRRPRGWHWAGQSIG